MIKFIHCRAENFSCFREVEFVLDSNDLVLVSGKVTGSSAFDSNSAGKSSLLQTIIWVLYGKLIRTQGKDEVVNNRVGKNCAVSILLEQNGQSFLISRYRSHKDFANKLIVRNKDGDDISEVDPQVQVEKILGMSFALFCHCVFFGQGVTKRFSGCTDGERKAVLEEILDLERFRVGYTKLGDRRKAVQKDLEQVQQEQAAQEIRLGEKQVRLKEQQEAVRFFEEQQKQRITNLDVKIEELKVQETAKREELLGYSTKLFNSKETVKKNKEAVEAVKIELDLVKKTFQEKLDKYNLEVGQLTSEIRQKQSDLQTVTEKLMKLGKPGTQCNECGRPIGKEDIQTCRDRIQAEELVHNKLYAELGAKLKKLNTQGQAIEVQRKAAVSVADKKSDDAVAVEAAFNRDVSLWTNTAEGIQSYALPQLSKQVAACIVEKEGIEKEPQPQDPEATAKEIEGVENDLKLLNEGYAALEIEQHAISLAEQCLDRKGLPSLLMDSQVVFLSDRANFYAQKLTDGEIQIDISTTKQLKSTGSLTDELTVTVQRVGGGTSYTMTSGGENKRADLCIAFALRDLARSRAQTSTNLVIFDEAFESLDATGAERVIDLLEEEAKDSTVLVITHERALVDFFNTVWTVTRSTKGDAVLVT